MKKLAFVFLVYDSINHEDLWYAFFKDIDPNKYSIYIHYKTSVPLKYFERYKLPECIPTEYGKASLVEAQNVLLKEALKDSENENFIFVSNSCIPLKPFNYVYESLKPTVSYFNNHNQIDCFPRCDTILNYYDKSFIQKASQWCILNRKHAEIILQDDKLALWGSVFAPDEHYYITTLYMNKLQDELVLTLEFEAGSTTFTNWTRTKHRWRSRRGLKNYTLINEDELLYLLKSKSLFARKFMPNCSPWLNKPLYLESITTPSKDSVESEVKNGSD